MSRSGAVRRPHFEGGQIPLFRRLPKKGFSNPNHKFYALVNIADAAAVLRLGDGVSALRFRADDVMAAPAVARSLRATLGAGFVTSDWTVENASYFRAIRLEKMMMSLMLSLIIGVAAFNIVASLVMVVTDKTTDIAVLRTLGMGPDGVVRVFFVQGAVIGWAGVLIGVVLGVVLAINVPVIAPFLERAFGFQIMPGDVYYVTQVPSEIRLGDVLLIPGIAIAISLLATIFPSRAIRYASAPDVRFSSSHRVSASASTPAAAGSTRRQKSSPSCAT